MARPFFVSPKIGGRGIVTKPPLPGSTRRCQVVVQTVVLYITQVD